MEEFKYSPSRYKEMEEFLQKMGRETEDYNNKHGCFMSEKLFYDRLCEYGLKPSDMTSDGKPKDTSIFLERWENSYNQTNGRLKVFQREDFCCFETWLRCTSYLKLYIPLDFDHIDRGTTELFDFIYSKGISHSSKVGLNMRSDNIVVRVAYDDIDSAMDIINFVKENEYIMEGLNPTNPFLPTINGVGVMIENGQSYNDNICHLISAYVNMSTENGKPITLEGFNKWVSLNARAYIDRNDIPNFMEVYNTVMSGMPEVEFIESRKNYSDAEVRQMYALFLDAVKATYIKHGPGHVGDAIKEAMLSENFDYFSSGDNPGINYRELLSKTISPTQIKNIIETTIIASGKKVNGIRNLDIGLYISILFEDDMAFKFDEICNVTCRNYSKEHLEKAISTYIESGEPGFFSKYIDPGDTAVNYREELTKFSPEMVKTTIKTSLNNRGIITTDLSDSELISTYASTLEIENYTNKQTK